MTDASERWRRGADLSPLTIPAIFDARAESDPDYVYARFEGRDLRISELADGVNRFANALLALGLVKGDRVAVMLPNCPDYIIAYFAMIRLGIVQVPVNINLRGAALRYVLNHSALRAAVVDARFEQQIKPELIHEHLEFAIMRGGVLDTTITQHRFESLATHDDASRPPVVTTPLDTLLISYTSGTTGAPKGVLVCDRMLQAAGWAAATLSDPRENDVYHLWEPLYHIGGAQVLIVGLIERVTLALFERFSVSQFWDEVRRESCTHIHYLGGVVPLLLKAPPTPRDRDHRVRIAWGGGCPRAAWKPFEERFGVGVRECYGMTEASSFTTISREPRFGSVGKPLPYFDVRATDDSGREVGADISGEIRVRAKTTGLITAGYFRNPEATAAALVDGWLRTGDVGRRDEDGFFYYAGRLKDALRRRGENISAWEIERVFAEHPAVAECAVIGVDDPISEQEVKIIIKLNEKHDIKEMDLLKWSESRLPRFQIPRYVAFIDVFPKTPTERIRKELLSRDVSNDFDREKIRTRSSKHASRAAPPHSRRDDS